MSQGEAEPRWTHYVLDFWFGQLTVADWFAGTAAVDEQVRTRFRTLHEQLASASISVDVADPREVLAAVLVLDQFSRNMHRGTPLAFASDPIARRLARHAVECGDDRALTVEQRLFLYLPFEHSEDRSDQALGVRLVEELGNEEWTRYAKAHQSLIDRFGRFPHRNSILGRPSTPEELAALAEPGSSF